MDARKIYENEQSSLAKTRLQQEKMADASSKKSHAGKKM
jgi:hypothetical protein